MVATDSASSAGPVGIAHTHAAESHRGDGQTLLAESSRLHVLPPREACSLSVVISWMSVDHVIRGLARGPRTRIRHRRMLVCKEKMVGPERSGSIDPGPPATHGL